MKKYHLTKKAFEDLLKIFGGIQLNDISSFTKRMKMVF